ncbi:hypothetical protein [Aeoliella mucimassa]|uniref:Uncharacterized protein n=1 Tax=Aeoliella mucimassa TaxID=2527972 RepID=A0A518ANI2_9BACT|nr:hypothetical protein [Aeoliella mucimassa]QDU56276.1 hypothetical protein Pan181_24850 [Aeoliella mucimassa]
MNGLCVSLALLLIGVCAGCQKATTIPEREPAPLDAPQPSATTALESEAGSAAEASLAPQESEAPDAWIASLATTEELLKHVEIGMPINDVLNSDLFGPNPTGILPFSDPRMVYAFFKGKDHSNRFIAEPLVILCCRTNELPETIRANSKLNITAVAQESIDKHGSQKLIYLLPESVKGQACTIHHGHTAREEPREQPPTPQSIFEHHAPNTRGLAGEWRFVFGSGATIGFPLISFLDLFAIRDSEVVRIKSYRDLEALDDLSVTSPQGGLAYVRLLTSGETYSCFDSPLAVEVNDPPAEPGAFKCTPGGRAHLFNKWKYGVAT